MGNGLIHNNPNNPSVAQVDAIRIDKAGSRLGEVLPLDGRYGKAVKGSMKGWEAAMDK
jgi:hypothetical protein